jgi:hypothetical protein
MLGFLGRRILRRTAGEPLLIFFDKLKMRPPCRFVGGAFSRLTLGADPREIIFAIRTL